MCASFLQRIENVTDSIIPFLPDTLKESDRASKVKEISPGLKKEPKKVENMKLRLKHFTEEMNIISLFLKPTRMFVWSGHLLHPSENSVEIRITGCGHDIQVILPFSEFILIQLAILQNIPKRISP